jgi:hypothetical protein
MGPSVVASWVETIIRTRAELLLLLLRQRPKDFGLPCGQHDFQILNQWKGLIRKGPPSRLRRIKAFSGGGSFCSLMSFFLDCSDKKALSKGGSSRMSSFVVVPNK